MKGLSHASPVRKRKKKLKNEGKPIRLFIEAKKDGRNQRNNPRLCWILVSELWPSGLTLHFAAVTFALLVDLITVTDVIDDLPSQVVCAHFLVLYPTCGIQTTSNNRIRKAALLQQDVEMKARCMRIQTASLFFFMDYSSRSVDYFPCGCNMHHLATSLTKYCCCMANEIRNVE